MLSRLIHTIRLLWFFRIREEQANEINCQRHQLLDVMYARRISGNLMTRGLDSFEKLCPVYQPDQRSRSQGNQLSTIECSAVLNPDRIAEYQQKRPNPRFNDV